MSILQEKSLLFNSKKKISIAAEDISSDAGLLLIADFRPMSILWTKKVELISN